MKQGELGVFHQGVGIFGVCGKQGDAAGDPEWRREFVDPDLCLDLLDEVRGQPVGAVRRRPRQDCGEFIPPMRATVPRALNTSDSVLPTPCSTVSPV
jgi:hypothetical protein